MASVVLDFNSISEEDIKKATEQLSKQISTEVNNAMKLGLTGSLNIYSKTVGTYVSIALKDSLLKVLNEDLAKQFSDFMSKKVFGEGFARSIKSSLEDAFKTLPAFKVNVVPVIKPDSMAPVDVASRPVGDSTPVPSQFKGGAGNNEGLGRLSESSLDLVASQALLLNAQNKAVKSLTQMAEQLDKAIEKQKDLTKEHEEALDTQKKKKTEEKAEAGVEAEQGVAGKPKGSGAPSMFDNIAQSSKMVFLYYMVQPLKKLLRDVVMSYMPRQREALTAAGTVVPSGGLSENPQQYMKFSKQLKQKMEHSPLLDQFGGENAFKEFMGLKGITGGFKPQDMADNGADRAAEAMETMAAKAILAGMNLDEFAKKTQEGILKFGMNQERSEKFFLGLADKAKLLNVPLENLYSNINSANGSIRIWGHSLSESYGIATRFSKSLEQGTISMGNIIDFATALHKTGEGQSLLIMDLMAKHGTIGSDISKAVRDISKGDPTIMRTLFEKVSEGYTGIAKELGLDTGTLGKKGFTDEQLQRRMRQGSFQAVQAEAKLIAGDDPNAQRFILKKLFSSVLGLSGDTSHKNIDLLLGTYADKSGAFDGTPRELLNKKGDEDVKNFKKGMEGILSPVDKATLWIKDAAITISDKVYNLLFPGAKNDLIKQGANSFMSSFQKGDVENSKSWAKILDEEGAFTSRSNVLFEVVSGVSDVLKKEISAGGLSPRTKETIIEVFPIVFKGGETKEFKDLMDAVDKNRVNVEHVNNLLKVANRAKTLNDTTNVPTISGAAKVPGGPG